jgi:homoserine/homoserine lactone efflux protein
MSVNLWWFYLLTCIVADLTPGPAVLLVISNSAKYGPRRTIATICGSLLANILYFAICATSLGALLFSSGTAFLIVKWIGAAYLTYLGIRALVSRNSSLIVPTGAPYVERSAMRLGLEAIVLQLSNPKALLWFGAIVPQFIDPQRDIVRQIVILGATGTTTEFPILLGYAILAGRIATLSPEYGLWTSRISGLFLIGAGGGLALTRRG